MNTLNVAIKNQIKELVNEAVSEALEKELMKVRSTLFNFVSGGEQEDVEKRYGKPTRSYARDIHL